MRIDVTLVQIHLSQFAIFQNLVSLMDAHSNIRASCCRLPKDKLHIELRDTMGGLSIKPVT